MVRKLVGDQVDALRAIAYLALPALVAAPVGVSQLGRSWMLYAPAATWSVVKGVLLLLVTLSTPHAISVPRDTGDVLFVCGRRYAVQVVDGSTRAAARLHAVFFVVTSVVGVLNGQRWLRDAGGGGSGGGGGGAMGVVGGGGSGGKFLNYEEVCSAKNKKR